MRRASCSRSRKGPSPCCSSSVSCGDSARCTLVRAMASACQPRANRCEQRRRHRVGRVRRGPDPHVRGGSRRRRRGAPRRRTPRSASLARNRSTSRNTAAASRRVIQQRHRHQRVADVAHGRRSRRVERRDRIPRRIDDWRRERIRLRAPAGHHLANPIGKAGRRRNGARRDTTARGACARSRARASAPHAPGRARRHLRRAARPAPAR